MTEGYVHFSLKNVGNAISNNILEIQNVLESTKNYNYNKDDEIYRLLDDIKLLATVLIECKECESETDGLSETGGLAQ